VAILPLIDHKWLKWSRDKHNKERHKMLRFRVMVQPILYATQTIDVTVSYVGHAFQICHVF